jgi:tRNA-specific 2-thiouridylase
MHAKHAKRRVVVGLSGGVDSAVAAWLLKEQGWEVVGLFMKNWEDEDSTYCSARQDWIDAVSVADVLGIEIEAVNFAAEYRDRVFAEFLREYSAGRTPNPDVLCNAEIKFKAFLDHALRLGADAIATGHYARLHHGVGAQAGQVALLRGRDPSKDQSYFLHRLSQAQLAQALFPIGELHKKDVRALAARLGLPNAAKKDSTGICFVGERPFREFLARYLPSAPGPILTDTGRCVGEHIGLAFYTLGQRKGIGVGGQASGSGEPWYVARKDLQHNTLYVVQGHDHPWLLSDHLSVADAHWVAGSPPEPGAALSAKTRYRQADAAVNLHLDPAAPQSFTLHFATPQWAVTPGQSAVLYQGEVCLGGGIITA